MKESAALPSMNPNDPTWIIIEAALTRASDVASRHGYSWVGRSCSVVSAIALWCVMWNRNWTERQNGTWALDGLGPITRDVSHIGLAYADHYLDRRANSGRGMPTEQAIIQTETYAAVKKTIVGLKGMESWKDKPDPKFGDEAYARWAPVVGKYLEVLARENRCKPLSAPTPEHKSWAYQGVKDGEADYAVNKSLNNDPAFFAALQVRASIPVPPECRPRLSDLIPDLNLGG